ncbi:MAG TPA: glycosyltransferase N-terminal domain-containing protein, partial [Chlamydiales bacterium]|nr:glycosyltransferase N-terminal domain-containing protein [Chlamydiales bacterium]
NLLSALKQSGCKNILVSGKLSERSAHRFKTFSRFAKKLFSRFDLLCIQNEEHYQRFLPLVPDPTKLHVTGNLKLDIEPQKVDIDLWRKKVAARLPIITISCTHDPEEEMLLDALDSPNWLIFLVPRHPERFQEIAQLLNRKKIPFTRWSQLNPEGKRVILIDAMGQLPICYSLSRLAIVAGSYIPKIGGHNVLEPCLYGIPAFFGPHMFAQAEFAARVLEAGAGRQVPLQALRQTISNFLNDSQSEAEMKQAANRLILQGRGATSRVLERLNVSEPVPKFHTLGQRT